MKIIFLDIDGVLNHRKSMERGIHLDPECVTRLDRLCVATGADIVVSSTWRVLHSQPELRSLLHATVLRHGQVIGITPRHVDPHFIDPRYSGDYSPHAKRGREIAAWLEGRDSTDYVILDDDSDMLDHQRPYFVQVDREHGLTDGDVERARQILEGVQQDEVPA